MIAKQEYVERMVKLQEQVAANGLDAFVITGTDSIYYLTGISYLPFERPFFIIVKPGNPPFLLVPALEKVHLGQSPNVDVIHSYWDYPAPAGQRTGANGWLIC